MYNQLLTSSNYFYKIADLADLLKSLPISDEVINFILSLPSKDRGHFISAIKKNPSLSLEELKQSVKIKVPIEVNTLEEKQLVENFPELLAKWLLVQFRKFRNKNQYSYLINNINSISLWYNNVTPDIASYSFDDVIDEVSVIKTDISNVDPKILKFIVGIKEPLRSFLANILPILKPEDFAVDPGQLAAIQFIERRFAASIQNLEDWFEGDKPKISKYTQNATGFHEMLDDAEHWHRMICKAYPGTKYDPIDSSLIIYGPKWQNSEFDGHFIIELKSENDVMVEGNKMSHCVGNYANAVTTGSSRIFSLRDLNNDPKVTFETNPNMMFYRQAFGPKNIRPEKPYSDMIDEFKEIASPKLDEKNIIEKWDEFSKAEKYEILANYKISPKTIEIIVEKVILQKDIPRIVDIPFFSIALTKIPPQREDLFLLALEIICQHPPNFYNFEKLLRSVPYNKPDLARLIANAWLLNNKVKELITPGLVQFMSEFISELIKKGGEDVLMMLLNSVFDELAAKHIPPNRIDIIKKMLHNTNFFAATAAASCISDKNINVLINWIKTDKRFEHDSPVEINKLEINKLLRKIPVKAEFLREIINVNNRDINEFIVEKYKTAGLSIDELINDKLINRKSKLPQIAVEHIPKERDDLIEKVLKDKDYYATYHKKIAAEKIKPEREDLLLLALNSLASQIREGAVYSIPKNRKDLFVKMLMDKSYDVIEVAAAVIPQEFLDEEIFNIIANSKLDNSITILDILIRKIPEMSKLYVFILTNPALTITLLSSGSVRLFYKIFENISFNDLLNVVDKIDYIQILENLIRFCKEITVTSLPEPVKENYDLVNKIISAAKKRIDKRIVDMKINKESIPIYNIIVLANFFEELCLKKTFNKSIWVGTEQVLRDNGFGEVIDRILNESTYDMIDGQAGYYSARNRRVNRIYKASCLGQKIKT